MPAKAAISEAIGRVVFVSDGHILFVWPKRIWKEKSTKEGAQEAPSLETPLGAEVETASCHIISA